MTDRQVICSIPLDDYDWLRACAEADGCRVSDIVKQCVVFARQSSEEPTQEPTPQVVILSPEEVAQRRREKAREMLLDRQRAELEMLENGADFYVKDGAIRLSGTQPALPVAQFHTPAPGQPPVAGPDYADEPHAEEMEVPPDPDDGYVAPPPQRRPVAAQPEAFLAGGAPVPSGQRPGLATRPAGVNRELAVGLRSGDAGGNVVRSNFQHLGFSRGGI